MILQKSTLIECGLFNGSGKNLLDDCMPFISIKSFHAGTVIIEKDHEVPALYIIHSGKAGIYNEDVLLTEIGAGSVTGESMIAGTRATASIIALTETVAYFILKEDFFNLTKLYPQLIQNIFAQTVQRLRHSNETALKDARQKAEHLEKLVDERTSELQKTLVELNKTQQFRDQFLANMSHEIRTPMNAIMGITNLLIKSPLNTQQEKYLHVIKKSGDNLLVIINDILDLSKIEAGKMEMERVVFPLHQTIEHIQTILNVKAKEKGIDLLMNIGDDVPEYVFGDETRLTQIVMNLAGNAIKFTEKGKVVISLHNEETREGSHRILFSVMDSGIGIPEDKLEKIFESFGQASSDTTRKFGGTGLGLSISRQLVELHNSKLEVRSTFGEGSTFFFSLQMVASAPPQIANAEEENGMAEIGDIKVLLVEDNFFNQMVAKDTLESMFSGINVDIAENGRTAIAHASSNDYDLILMDLQLPDIDGFEVTKFIRNEIESPKNSVPICAMTASISKERIEKCRQSGMNDHIFKPFNPGELKEMIIKNISVQNK
jgi:signal transduction histidine kinase/CheY-like chemotaxis protein